VWKQIFAATWKTHKSQFSSIIGNLAKHRHLIETQASLSEIESARKAREIQRDHYEAELGHEDMRRRREVNNWLRAPRMEDEQHEFDKLRAKYPGTGEWLLEHPVFKDWFDPQFAVIPPLLWLNGIPGAGKFRKRIMCIQVDGGRENNSCFARSP
jgi:hypothetical protein